jgi:hypothetical protein
MVSSTQLFSLQDQKHTLLCFDMLQAIVIQCKTQGVERVQKYKYERVSASQTSMYDVFSASHQGMKLQAIPNSLSTNNCLYGCDIHHCTKQAMHHDFQRRMSSFMDAPIILRWW